MTDSAPQHALQQRYTATVGPATFRSCTFWWWGTCRLDGHSDQVPPVRTERLGVIPIIKPNTDWVLTSLHMYCLIQPVMSLALLLSHFTVEETEIQSFIHLLAVTWVRRSETRVWRRTHWLRSPHSWPLSDQALPHFTLEPMLLWKSTFSCRPAGSPNRKQSEHHPNHPASCKPFLSHPLSLLVSP